MRMTNLEMIAEMRTNVTRLNTLARELSDAGFKIEMNTQEEWSLGVAWPTPILSAHFMRSVP
tara:strand:- start:2623 stop:2808 length:186 start_codon:yes stop_codon:yes gene_type:complete